MYIIIYMYNYTYYGVHCTHYVHYMSILIEIYDSFRLLIYDSNDKEKKKQKRHRLYLEFQEKEKKSSLNQKFQ